MKKWIFDLEWWVFSGIAFVVYFLLIVLAPNILSLIGLLDNGYWVNVFTQLLDLILTTIVLGALFHVARDRQELRNLISDMASPNNLITIEAVRKLRERKWLHRLGYVNLVRADLHDADLFMVDLSSENKKSHLMSVNLQNAYLGFADLKNVDFFSADLRGVNFEYADLRGANFKQAKLEGAILPDGSKCEGENDEGRYKKIQVWVNKAPPSNELVSNYKHFALTTPYSRGLHFGKVKKVYDPINVEEPFYGNDLSNQNLGGAYLRDLPLRGKDLSNTTLIGANLRGVDLTDAILDGANLLYARYNAETTFPSGLKYKTPINGVWMIPVKTIDEFIRLMDDLSTENNPSTDVSYEPTTPESENDHFADRITENNSASKLQK